MGRWRRDNFSKEQPEPAPAERRAQERSPRIRHGVAQVLSGNILTHPEVHRTYPFLLFLALLMFLYIAHDYHVQALYRRHDQLSKQVETLRVRSTTYASKLMEATRRSKIIEEVEHRGIPLQESPDPPKIIDK